MAREDRIARRNARKARRESRRNARREARDARRKLKEEGGADADASGGGKGMAIAGAAITGATTLVSSLSKDTSPSSYQEESQTVGVGDSIAKIGSLTATGASVGGPVGAAVGAAVGIASVGIDYAKTKKFNKNLQKKQNEQKLKMGEEQTLTYERLAQADKERSLKYLSNINSPKYNRFKRSSYS